MIDSEEKIFIEVKNQEVLNQINLIFNAYSFISLCTDTNDFPKIVYTVYISYKKYITYISYKDSVKNQLFKMGYVEKQLEEILLL